MEDGNQIFNRKKKEFKFGPFHETYKWTAFNLTLGLMYPNPATEKFRIIGIVCLLLFNSPLIMLFLIEIYRCIMERDLFNIIRHSTIIGPYLITFLKKALMFYYRASIKELIDEMSHDYMTYNSLPHRYQIKIDSLISKCVVYTEKVWTISVAIAVTVFPFVAVITTLYSHIFDEMPKRYMVHDINNPFAEPEERFESPFYEIVFAYMTGSVIIWILNYSSYDALFGIITNHACIKMIVFCMKLEDAFDQQDDQLMHDGVKNFIDEQNRMYRFVDLIQNSYNIWLGMILAVTMLQLSSLMFHISMGYGFDLRYIFFSLICVAHIFLPCNYASNLKIMSTEIATIIYCSGWEKVISKKVAKVVPFIIARSQIPILLTFHIFEFDMELFVIIMKTSYSMFTLMRS